MAEAYKTLGQVAPAATTLTVLYTVPAITGTVVSTIIACNRGSVSATFRISIRVGGEADDPKQYMYYDVPIPANDSFAATLGITLGAADEIWVYGDTTDLTFQAWGSEIS